MANVLIPKAQLDATLIDTSTAQTVSAKDFSSGNVFPTFNQSTTGNAATATALQNARSIYGSSFNGTADISGPIAGTNGGTGVNNATRTFTMAGNVTHAGAFNRTFTATANTTLTLPITGTLATVAGAEQFTNKRVIPRIATVTSAATVTPAGDSVDFVSITAQAVALTLANPSGTPNNGQPLTIEIKDNNTSQNITYGSVYRAIGFPLPTATKVGQVLTLFGVYNSADAKWDVNVATNSPLLTNATGLPSTGIDPVAWTAWTPTVTAGSGTITTVSATGTYYKLGRSVFFQAIVTFSNNGTGAGNIQLTNLPFTIANNGGFCGINSASFVGLSGLSFTSGNKLIIFTSAGAYPGSNTAVLVISGVFEATT